MWSVNQREETIQGGDRTPARLPLSNTVLCPSAEDRTTLSVPFVIGCDGEGEGGRVGNETASNINEREKHKYAWTTAPFNKLKDEV